MDTEYDWMALKAIIFAIHSRAETYKLGIKPDRAVTSLLKVLFASEECKRILQEPADIFQRRTCNRLEKMEAKIKSIDKKLEKREHLLPEKRSIDLEGGIYCQGN